MTWVDNNKLFLLWRLNEPRFDRLLSFGAAEIEMLLSSSLIEYFTWKRVLLSRELVLI